MNDADLQERMQLAIERISEIKEEDQTIWDTLAKMDAGAKNLKTYFDSVAEFILYVYDVYEIVSQPGKIDLPLSKLQEINHNLYVDILPEHYGASFANPDYAVEKLGEYGKYLCMLYAEIRAMIAYAYEDEMQAMISLMELFLEVYGIFTASEGEKLPAIAVFAIAFTTWVFTDGTNKITAIITISSPKITSIVVTNLFNRFTVFNCCSELFVFLLELMLFSNHLLFSNL